MCNTNTKIIAAEIEFGGKQSGIFIGNPGLGNSLLFVEFLYLKQTNQIKLKVLDLIMIL